MTPRQRFLLLGCLMLGPLLAAYAADAPAWPQAKSDLKPDAAATFGTLPNGFRYIILPNKEPPGHVSLRLRVNAGSFMETEDQRGLAHFLEHMAFNGSKHFPPGEMVGYFQRLGMGFGADTNAHTGEDQTVYDLELPASTDKLLRDGFQFFSDVADGMLLLQTEVDSERGVILSEKRDRDDVAYRTYVASWDFYFPEARLPQRLPIGLESVIRESARDRFVNFYNKWYRPERMTLVAVGDVKPEILEPLIKEYFSGLAPRDAAAAEPDLGKFGTTGFQAILHREPEAPAVTMEIAMVAPFTLGPDRSERRVREFKLDAANFILSRRFQRIAREPNAPFSSAEANSETQFDAFAVSVIRASCLSAQWPATLSAIEQELRRALEYGFTEAEINEARANFLNYLEQAAKAAPTRLNRTVANAVVASLEDNEVFTSPADMLAWARPVLAALTPQQCRDVFKEAWGQSGRRLYVSGNLDLPDPAQTLAAAYQKSAAVAVTKPAEAGAEAFGYASAGEPGKVVERHEVADLGITQLRFANNVRVNLKKTDFEADKVRVLVQFGGGKLDLPAAAPALAFVAGAVFTEGGVGKHSAEDLDRLLAGKTTGASFSAGEKYFEFGGLTNARDLRLELELLKAYVTDPGYRPEALARARRQFPEVFNTIRQNVEAAFSVEVPRFLASGDYRFGLPTETQVGAVTMDEVRAWLAPFLRDSYMEISLVGDFDPAATEAALAATFGTLPARAAQRADYSRALNVHFPVAAEGTEKTFSVGSVIQKSEAATFWPTVDEEDIGATRILGVAAAVLDDRLRVQIREELGQAYSPYAANQPSHVYPKYGYTLALTSSDPKLAAALADKEREIASVLAANGATADEFNRAILPLRKSLAESERQNAYWLGRVLGGAQAHPAQLEWARTRHEAFDHITLEQVNALAKEYLKPAQAVRVLVMPEAPANVP